MNLPNLYNTAPGSDVEFSKLCRFYAIHHLNKRKLEAPTTRRMIGTLEDALGHLKPHEFDQATIDDYADSRQVASGSMRRELGVLRAIFRFAAKRKKIYPYEVPVLDMPDESPIKDVWLNEQQEEEFLQLAADTSILTPRLTRIHRFVWIALYTGARKTAIEGLTWNRVDLDHGLIDFRDPKVPLSKKRRVPVRIADKLWPVLMAAYTERSKINSLQYVLDCPTGITHEFRKFVQKTPYDWVTPHILRHTAATLMLRAGVDIASVAATLGDTISTVEKRYAHHHPDYTAQAVNRKRL